MTIKELNDQLRTKLIGGKIVLTRSVAALDNTAKTKVLRAMMEFTNFTKDNNPYGENDCATFDVDGETYMFKIDYYDRDLFYGSPDPTNPNVTTRVLTLMHISDY